MRGHPRRACKVRSLEHLHLMSSAVCRVAGCAMVIWVTASVVPADRAGSSHGWQGLPRRTCVLAAYDRGMATQRLPEIFGVKKVLARRIEQRRRETGETSPRLSSCARATKIDRARLAARIEVHRDAKLKQLRSILSVRCAERRLDDQVMQGLLESLSNSVESCGHRVRSIKQR